MAATRLVVALGGNAILRSKTLSSYAEQSEGDPQGLDAQRRRLEAAGVEILPSNAQAARFAALVLRPDHAPRLLGPEP